MMKKKFIRKCLIMLFVFALFGCKDEVVEERDNISEFLGLKEEIDTVAYPYYKKNTERYYELSGFLRRYYYYKNYDETFSLDDDITIVNGGREFYIYSKTKNGQKKIWSSECEDSKFLSEEQIRVLDSLENVVRKDFKEKPVKGEWNVFSFNWKGKNFDVSLDERFEYVLKSHFEDRKSETQFYLYLKKIFEQGCKGRKNKAVGIIKW